MLNTRGVPNLEMVKKCFPDEQQLVKMKAIVECYEEIPCNPCSTVCPTNAIVIGDDINSIPKVYFDKCIGCGLCVVACPGLAIMMSKIEGEKVRFRIPYEFLPLPKPKDIWNAINREGEVIGTASIEKVITSPKQDKTVVLEVLVDYSLFYQFITVRCPDE